MSATNQNLIRQYAGNLRQIQTLYETCPIYAQPKPIRREEETVVTSTIFTRDNAEIVLKACERYWHFSYLQRHQANEFLIKEEPGSFIVRRSSKSNSYALSIRLPPSCAEPVTHYLILKDDQGYVVQGSKLPFHSLYALLAHFCFKQSGGMPCLLSPPRVPISKSSLQPAKSGYATLEEDTSTGMRRRLNAATVSRMIQSSRAQQVDDYETPPPLPPPRQPQDYRSVPSVRHDISILPVDGSEDHSQSSTGDSLDPRYSDMFDQLAQKVSNFLNGDSSQEMDDIEDFELEVSASDDSGDELVSPKDGRGHKHSGNTQSRRSGSFRESSHRNSPMTGDGHSLPSNDRGVPPVPPRHTFPAKKPPSSSPSPPPLPPRLNRDRNSQTQLSESPAQHSHSPTNPPRPASRSPLPPRPPKPYYLHKTDRMDQDNTQSNGRDLSQSITESTVETWRARSNDLAQTPSPHPLSPPSPMDSGTPLEETKQKSILPHSSGRGSQPTPTPSDVEVTEVSSVPCGESAPDEAMSRGSKNRGSAKLKKKKKKKLKLLFHVKTPSERIADFIKGSALLEEKGSFSQELSGFCNRVKCKNDNYQELLQETRQCMDQLRRILLKDYSAELEKRGRKRCKVFDEVVERSLQDVVIQPLHTHIVSVMDDHFQNSKDLHIVRSNIQLGRFMKQSEVGIRDNLVAPDGQAMAAIAETLEEMQKMQSAMRKMELLLEAVKLTYDNIRDAKDPSKSMRGLGADDFLPIFVWVLIQCQCYRAELEAEYMWGLVHPSLLNGEGGYYLTTLTSAVHVIKQLKFDNRPEDPMNESLRSMSDCMAFLEVYIEDPVSGSLMEPTLIPVHPTMDTQNACQLIVSKHQDARLDPAHYGLFIVEDHKKTELPSNACPQAIKSRWSNKDSTQRYFAYLKKSS